MKSPFEVFQFIFGCRHSHLSRVFTIKLRTYRVCFDGGREFDLPDAHPQLRREVLATNPYQLADGVDALVAACLAILILHM